MYRCSKLDTRVVVVAVRIGDWKGGGYEGGEKRNRRIL